MKEKFIKVFGVTLLLFITGCVKTVWEKSGATVQDYRNAHYECLRDSERAYGIARINPYSGEVVQTTRYDEHMYIACMLSKGFTRKQVPIDTPTDGY